MGLPSGRQRRRSHEASRQAPRHADGRPAYSHNAEWGTLRTTFTGDTLNNSNGTVGDVTYLYKFNLDALTLVPGVGVMWNSKNQNKYYYGVSANESRRSGLGKVRTSS